MTPTSPNRRTPIDEDAMAYLEQIEGLSTLAKRSMAEADQLRAEIEQLARDVISLAEDGGMPDSYQQTDQRMIRARAALTKQEDKDNE